jgi:hypothetical protein
MPKNNFTTKDERILHLTTQQSLEIMSRCKFHDTCYAPFCPLDIYQSKWLFSLKGFHKCKLSARRRKEIAKDYKELKYDGLNPDEWNKTKRWRELSDDKKNSIRHNFNKGRLKLQK